MQITIFGKGTMGKAIAKNFEDAGNTVSFLGHEDGAELGRLSFWPFPMPLSITSLKGTKINLQVRLLLTSLTLLILPLSIHSLFQLVPPQLKNSKLNSPRALLLKLSILIFPVR